MLRAVIAVESGGTGFLPDGRPRILLEGHLLWRRLRVRGISPVGLARQHPTLCFPSWTRRWYRGGTGEWERLERVIRFGAGQPEWEGYKKAGLESCSWGLFQLLGMNYAAAGFRNVYELKHAHEAGEPEQLAAILRWMGTNGLLGALRRKDWIRFTRGYNGPGQVPLYSARLAAAYRREA